MRVFRFFIQLPTLLLTAALATGPVWGETVPSVPRADGTSNSAVVASGVRIAGDSARTRFVVDMSGEVDYSVFFLDAPYRVVIDLPRLHFDLAPRDTARASGLVEAWRFGRISEERSRIVLHTSLPVALDNSFVLPALSDQPARLVLDLVSTDRSAFLAGLEVPVSEESRHSEATQKKTTGKGDLQRQVIGNRDLPVILLDPGHGGVDPGATGVSGLQEKTATLAFALYLRSVLEHGRRYDVILTREDDRFVTLNERVALARRVDADLMVSIHADAVEDGGDSLRGASVYTLSTHGSDRAAAALAARENMADRLAPEGHTGPDDILVSILSDVERRATAKLSRYFARILVDELGTATRLIRNPVRSANFRVLRTFDVPSVLLELGYLSNQYDEQLLTSTPWRTRVADAIRTAADRYFSSRAGLASCAGQGATGRGAATPACIDIAIAGASRLLATHRPGQRHKQAILNGYGLLAGHRARPPGAQINRSQNEWSHDRPWRAPLLRNPS